MQAQKTAKPAAKSATPTQKTSKTLADRAKQARAVLKSISAPSLRTLRNRVLDEALKRFERPGGWVNGSLKMQRDTGDGGYSFCAMGGIIESKATKKVKQAAVDAVYAAIPEKYKSETYGDYGFENGGPVVEFNDDQRRKTNVVAAFKKAKRQPLRKGK